MILSYAGRLMCAGVVVVGLIHLVVEGFLWVVSPWALRMADGLPARQRERLLYTINVLPMLAAVTLTCAVCVPQYVRSESNLDPEAISLWCIAGAIAVGIWYCSSLLRGGMIAARTSSLMRSCRRNSVATSFVRTGLRILSYPGKAYSVALVGLFQPVIMISESLLGEGGLSEAAIDVVLDHEVSHARELDNWKLFSLFCLPGLPLRLRNGLTWPQMWQSAAEWAADDDAVRSDSSRVLLLAETLVAVARRSGPQANRVCMALACGEAGLAARVNRLIDRPYRAGVSHGRNRAWGLAMGLAGLVGATVGVVLAFGGLMERLIRLGQA